MPVGILSKRGSTSPENPPAPNVPSPMMQVKDGPSWEAESSSASKETVLFVDGMMCGHCTSTVQAALEAVPEVSSVVVDLETKLARVSSSEGVVVEALISAVVAMGKTAELVQPAAETVLNVKGMMCGHCLATVEGALSAVKGVTSAKVDLDKGTATVVGTASVEAMLAACNEVDHPATLATPPPAAAEPMVLKVEGMMCDHCLATVEGALSAIEGVTSAKVDLDKGLAYVTGSASAEACIAACNEVDHPATLAAPPAAGPLVTASAAAGMPSRLAPYMAGSGHSTPRQMRAGGAVAVDINGNTTPPRKTAVPSPFATGTTPTLKRLSSLFAGEEETSALLNIGGMTCAACVGAVEKALLKTPGVQSVSVSLMGKRGQVHALAVIPAVIPAASPAASPAAIPAASPAALSPARASRGRPQVFYLKSEASVETLVGSVVSIGFEASEFDSKEAAKSPTSAYVEEAEYYRGQFFGSLPFSVGAVYVSKVVPLFGPDSLRTFFSSELIPGLEWKTLVVVCLVTPVQVRERRHPRSPRGPRGPRSRPTLMIQKRVPGSRSHPRCPRVWPSVRFRPSLLQACV